MEHTVDLLMTELVTHDVRRFITTWPEGLHYEAGQGVEVALDLDGWREEGRPFTPTGSPGAKVLELTVKRYPEHDGMTERLHRLEPGARLHVSDSFGTITYRGPGTFIAAGAGITPFLAIVRQLAAENRLDGHRLAFCNKTRLDVICEQELRHYFGERALWALTRDEAPGFHTGRFDRALLKQWFGDDLAQRFYVCGPPEFVGSMEEALRSMGAAGEGIVFEE
jgi:ferredoxin-NADP reductase